MFSWNKGQAEKPEDDIKAAEGAQVAVAKDGGTAVNQEADTIIDHPVVNIYLPPNASSEGQTVASSRQLNLLGLDPIGRDEFTSKIVGKVLDERKRVVEVYGEPGIGKTTVCLHIVRELKDNYANVYAVNFTDIREKEAVIAEMLMALGIKPGETNALEGQLVYAANKRSSTLFYMDNMEDAMRFDSFNDWFIRFINAVGWTIVFSSRERFNNHMIYSEALEELSPEHALTLFTKHWQNNQRQILPNDEPILKDLLKDMGHHPLSIVLVATQGRYQSVKDLSNAWHKNPFDDNISVDGAGRHKNLLKALSFSYESVSEDKRAIEIWAVMTFVPTQISNEMFDAIFGDSVEKYRDAAARLVKNSLLRGDKSGFSMLNPIKGFIFTRDNEGEVCDSAIDRFFDSLTMFYKNANNFRGSDYGKWNNLAIDALPIAIELLSKRESHSKAETLTNEMHNHWKYKAFESLVFLQGYLPEIKTPIVRASVLDSMGDLEIQLGKVEAARGHFAEAEKLFLAMKSNLGRANALLSMGVLERHLGEVEAAQGHYAEAEKLFLAEKNNLGRANVLRSMGDMECQLGEVEAARGHFTQAEKLYRAVKDNLGRANVLQSMGDLEIRLGEVEAAQGHFAEAEKLYRAVKDNLGRANVLRSMGDMECYLGEVEAAQGHYAEAEKLFLAEKYNLGRANVLRSMGDLEREHGEIDKSIPLYIQALDLYKLVQEPMGYAHTIAELCRAYAMVGKRQDALTYLDLLKTVIDGQPDVVKSYLEDCAKEALDLLSPD
ncbi:MAG: tetratricopeptide repeat protein [Oscillospiraceae bacterium]|jgi:tetratricopeptide (TPR) repeat protein|nr:tetratricopeptide repeat protein [Oscillospiraceae bacterium]